MSLEVYDPTAEGTAQGWPEPQALPPALPPVAPFDVEALPDALRPFVMDTAARLGCPIEFVAAASMACAGACIGRARAIAPATPDGWTEFPNVWAALVGEPSLMKSPAMNEATAALYAIEAAEREAHAPAAERYKRDFERWEIERKAAANAMQKAANAAFKNGERLEFDDLPEEPERPPAPRLIVNDATTEALVRVAAGNPKGLLLVRDELAAWLSTFRKAGREGDRGFYLETATGKNRITIDRKSDGEIFIDPLALSICGSIQPGPLREIVKAAADGAANDGLLQRFGLLVWPDAPAGRYELSTSPPDAAARASYARTLESLRCLTGNAVLQFTPDALAAFTAWHESEINELRNEGPNALLASHRFKMAGKTCLGLALICELADNPTAGAVGLTAARRAIQFCEILKTHAARLYAPQVSPDVEACRLLAGKITSGKLGDGFTCRDVYRRGWAGLDAEAVPLACESLCKLGWLRPVEATGPGRPSDCFAVNPQAMEPAR